MSRRRRGGAVRALLGLVALLAVAVGGVVLVLRTVEVDLPTSSRCVATAGDVSASLSPEQAGNAALIAGIAVERGLPARAVTIALATAMQESRLENIDYGDRDSVGLFQQRPSQGWGTVAEIMDPVYSTNTFYDALVELDGYEQMEITVAAQAVQRSAFPDAYAQHEDMARAFASALTGWSPAALVCELGEDAGSTAVADLAARDLPGVTVQTHDEGAAVLVHGPAADGDDARARWALAQWAVATAGQTGVVEVAVDGQVWSRETGTWEASEGAAAGLVRVR